MSGVSLSVSLRPLLSAPHAAANFEKLLYGYLIHWMLSTVKRKTRAQRQISFIFNIPLYSISIRSEYITKVLSLTCRLLFETLSVKFQWGINWYILFLTRDLSMFLIKHYTPMSVYRSYMWLFGKQAGNKSPWKSVLGTTSGEREDNWILNRLWADIQNKITEFFFVLGHSSLRFIYFPHIYLHPHYDVLYNL